MSDNLTLARQYLEALERRVDRETLARFFTPDVVYEELPNRISPNGAKRDLAGLLEGQERGKQILTSQRFEIVSALEQGSRVALEVRWTGTLAIALGSIPAGGEMRARSGMFLEFRDGKVAAQRNYDCFDPW